MIQKYMLLALFIGFLGGLAPVIHKTLLSKYNPVTILIISSVFYASCSLIYASWNAEHIIKDIRKITNFDILTIALTSIIAGFFSHILYFDVLQKHDSHIVVALMDICPLFTLILAYLFLNEKVNLYGALGVFFIVTGIFCLAYNGAGTHGFPPYPPIFFQ